jgi:hypothetical protein
MDYTSQEEMATVVVAEAWEAVAANGGFIQKAFFNCGISIHPDGSQDYLISIKDIVAYRGVIVNCSYRDM